MYNHTLLGKLQVQTTKNEALHGHFIRENEWNVPHIWIHPIIHIRPVDNH